MSETYCGKSCSSCMYREQLECPGCKMGLERNLYKECEVAKCSISKGHESCEKCFLSGSCELVRECEQIPLKNKRKKEQEQALRVNVLKKKIFLGRWLGILLLAAVLQIVCNVILKAGSEKVSPEIYKITSYIEIVYYIFYSFIMLVLSKEEAHYRVAGYCSLLAGGISFFVIVFAAIEMVAVALMYISLAKMIIAFVGEYSEFTAHSAVMENVDCELSEKWKELWKFTAKIYVCIAACIVVINVISLLDVIALVIVEIVFWVAGIRKIICLYQTAKFCRIA